MNAEKISGFLATLGQVAPTSSVCGVVYSGENGRITPYDFELRSKVQEPTPARSPKPEGIGALTRSHDPPKSHLEIPIQPNSRESR